MYSDQDVSTCLTLFSVIFYCTFPLVNIWDISRNPSLKFQEWVWSFFDFVCLFFCQFVALFIHGLRSERWIIWFHLCLQQFSVCSISGSLDTPLIESTPLLFPREILPYLFRRISREAYVWFLTCVTKASEFCIHSVNKSTNTIYSYFAMIRWTKYSLLIAKRLFNFVWLISIFEIVCRLIRYDAITSDTTLITAKLMVNSSWYQTTINIEIHLLSQWSPWIAFIRINA